ncbi:hypothetical protein ABW20_dc0110293 [Dactylellina cionopaga]|nr:hypothetical protein ABW20_dc0110293 [Dactylellina cionopaga]
MSDVKYLLSLGAIRERSQIVWGAAKAGKLTHFDFHQDRLEDVVKFVTSVIERDFGPDRFNTIPPHGRWQHFEVGDVPRVTKLQESWAASGCDDLEICRRLIDLFFVSVLLDAGAGDVWRYVEPGTQNKYERSEGIAVASLYMFNALAFTAEKDGNVPIVDGRGLENLTVEELAAGFQVSEQNAMTGVESRTALLQSLGKSLLSLPEIFGSEGRPGKLVDYILADDSSELDILKLWDVLQTVLIPSWPKDRTTVDGSAIGDAWPLKTLEFEQAKAGNTKATAGIQPFHKLTQWLTYSLMVPFQRILNKKWINAESLTGLPEYRNGGLFVDLEVLSLKSETLERGVRASGQDLPLFDPSDDVIVEWRAMTLALLDRLYEMIAARMTVSLSMAQVLEAGTWKSGREIAAKKRPDTKSSPILIRSDGTLF